MEDSEKMLERGRFEGMVLEALKNIEDKLDRLFRDHDARLDRLEKVVSELRQGEARRKGIIVALGAVAGATVNVVSLALQALFHK